jgi:hypothetical protein
MPLITLLTDFGDSEYVGAMKGVILTECPGATVVDLTHRIPPFDVRQAAYALHVAREYYPQGTVHCAVVDPGVGTERRGLIVDAGGQTFVGPDNGIFSLLPEAEAVYEILLPPRSRTFWGRDVFAPAAARLAGGANPGDLGRRVEGFLRLPLLQTERMGKKVRGQVLAIDPFGNVITNIQADLLDRMGVGYGDRITLTHGAEKRTVPVVESYAYAPMKEIVAVIGSSGFLEFAVNQGRASEVLEARSGDGVEVTA